MEIKNEEEILNHVDDPQRYNDEVIYPDKVKINFYYLHHYSFLKDLQMIFCTLSGRKMKYNNELI